MPSLRSYLRLFNLVRTDDDLRKELNIYITNLSLILPLVNDNLVRLVRIYDTKYS